MFSFFLSLFHSAKMKDFAQNHSGSPENGGRGSLCSLLLALTECQVPVEIVLRMV